MPIRRLTIPVVAGIALAVACTTTPSVPDDELGTNVPDAGVLAAPDAAPDAGPTQPPPTAADAGTQAPDGGPIAAEADGGVPDGGLADATDGGTPDGGAVAAAPGLPEGELPVVDKLEGSLIPGQKEHGGWVSPEILEIAAKGRGTKADATRILWLNGTNGPGCNDVYRFRLVFGARERYADVAAYRRKTDAAACHSLYVGQFRERPSELAQMDVASAVSGHFFVVFSAQLRGDAATRADVLKAVSAFLPTKISKLPRKVNPAGAKPDEVVRERRPRPYNWKPKASPSTPPPSPPGAKQQPAPAPAPGKVTPIR